MAGISEPGGCQEFRRSGAEGSNAYIAKAYYNQATELLTRGVHAESEKYLREVVRLWPEHTEAWNNLGTAVWQQGRMEEAEDYYRRGLRLEPDNSDILNNLGNALVRQGKWDEALRCYEQALRLRPDLPEARRNRAYIWMAQGDLERGWLEYEWRLRCRDYQGPTVDLPRWNGEDLEGRAILLHAEQGLGDSLQFIRHASLVKRRGGRVIVACPKPLLEIVARCPGVDQVQDAILPVSGCQVQSSLMSLPAVLGITPASLAADVPYLSAEAARIEHWCPVVERIVSRFESRNQHRANGTGRLLRIGIAWQGNPRHRVDRRRSFPLRLLAPLGEVPGICLISLQKGEGTEQISELADAFPVAVLQGPEGDGEDRRSLLDTAAVMHHLDLVVTPDSAVAHLAGGLGVKVWVALPAVAEWRWMMDRADTPWYPTMTLFRQATPGDWEGVFHRMARDLGTLSERSPDGAGSA